MTPERLAEIRDRVTYNPEDWPITIELVAHIDTITAENDRLKGEVERLKRLNTSLVYGHDIFKLAALRVESTLRASLAALVTAVSGINDFLSDEALMDLICDIRHTLPNMESEERFDKSIVESIARWSKRDALSAALAAAKEKVGR